MKKIMILLIIIWANFVNAQATSGRHYCTSQDLKKLNAAFKDMTSEGATGALSKAKVGFRMGDCEVYSLEKIAKIFFFSSALV